MQFFKAGVQYGDWEGTAKADDIDRGEIHEYLTEKGLMKPSEFLLGIDFWMSGEAREKGKLDPPMIRCLFLEQRGPDFESVQNALLSIQGPIPVRVRDVKLSLLDFFRLFKRFSVVLTARDLSLGGREYQEMEDSD
jgi:hypothetical protein